MLPPQEIKFLNWSFTSHQWEINRDIFFHGNLNAKCRGCYVHGNTESIAINAACVCVRARACVCGWTYLLEAKLPARMNSSIDINSQQDQDISQPSHSKTSKGNFCQHTETCWRKHGIKTMEKANITAAVSPSRPVQINIARPLCAAAFANACPSSQLPSLVTIYNWLFLFFWYYFCHCSVADPVLIADL